MDDLANLNLNHVNKLIETEVINEQTIYIYYKTLMCGFFFQYTSIRIKIPNKTKFKQRIQNIITTFHDGLVLNFLILNEAITILVLEKPFICVLFS